MATPFKSVQAAIRYDNARVLTWDMEPGYNYPANFSLKVENSRTGGDWETLADVSSTCFYVDSRRRNWNKHMDECYRLRLTVSDTEEYVSEPVHAGRTECYPFSTEANNAILNIEKAIELSGVTGVLIKRKTFGPRCPLCTDFDGTSTVNEHCPRCMGTGVDGGYYNGITLNLVKNQMQRTGGVSQLGEAQTGEVTGRCIAYPWIQTGDIWSEDGTNARYSVAACTPSAVYKTVPLVYTLVLSRIEYTDSAYTAAMDDKVSNKDTWTAAEVPANTQAGWNTAFDSL